MAERRNPPTPNPVPVTDLGSGLRAIVDRKFLESELHQSQHSRAVRAGAHPAILDFEKRFIRRMRMHGIPIFAHCVWRSGTLQDRLYVQGVSKAQAGESPHNWGCAVDLIHGRLAWNMPRQSWLMIGHIGKEVAAQAGIKVVWGGDWDGDDIPVPEDPDESFWDPAHWQLKDWRALWAGYPFEG